MDENTLKRLMTALAKLDTAFPAGDYKLNSRQNVALNEILDISFELSKNNQEYKNILDCERDAVNLERIRKIEEMKKMGII